MSNVGGEQIVGVLSSHGKELCHVYELKGLTFFKASDCLGEMFERGRTCTVVI